MSFQPLPDPPTSVVVPEMVPRGTVKTVFNPAADNFAQSLNPFSLYLQDHTSWIQNANQVMNVNMEVVYNDTVIAKEAAQQAVLAAGQQVGLAENQVVLATEQADRAEAAAESATGVSNYRGRWVDAVGAATAGGTYEYADRLWLLLEDVSDITASEPSNSNVDWLAVGGGGGAAVPQEIGQIVYSFQELDKLPEGFYVRTSQTYLQSEYPELFNVLGVGDAPPNIKLPNPSALPAGAGQGVAFSTDGDYMAVVTRTHPFIFIYKRDGDTFTKLDNPSALPAGDGYGVAFSTDGTYMAVAHATTPFITIYKREGDTFNKLPNPSALPAGAGQGVAFSTDGDYMASVHAGAAGSLPITIYKRDGDTFNKLPNPSALPAGAGYGVAFSTDGTYMAVSHATTPFITIYKGDYPFDIETEFYVPDVDDLTPQQVGDWLPSVQGKAYVRAK